MSNPTHRMECNAEEAQRATGRTLVCPSWNLQEWHFKMAPPACDLESTGRRLHYTPRPIRERHSGAQRMLTAVQGAGPSLQAAAHAMMWSTRGASSHPLRVSSVCTCSQLCHHLLASFPCLSSIPCSGLSYIGTCLSFRRAAMSQMVTDGNCQGAILSTETVPVSAANNLYIFPGLALGAHLGATKVHTTSPAFSTQIPMLKRH